MKHILFLVIAFFCAVTVMAQQKVRGTVLDDDREPIVGASVTVDGTSISTVTDMDGNFILLNVPDAATTLVIESIGMNPKKVSIRPMQVVMQPTGECLLFFVKAGMDMSKYSYCNSNFKMGYHFTFGIDAKMSKHWSFQPAVQLSNRGGKYSFEKHRYKHTENWNPFYLDIPLNFALKYKLGGHNKLVLNFGPCTSVGLFGKVKSTTTDMPDEEYDVFKDKYKYSANYSNALFNRYSFGLSYGVGVELNRHILIGVSGKNMMLFSDEQLSDNDFSIGIEVGYRF